jgi:hypothetical protein
MAKNLNEGGNGFHLFTVVTDGYGNLISESADGLRLAQVHSVPEQIEDPAPFAELARLTFAVLNGDADPLDPAADEMACAPATETAPEA